MELKHYSRLGFSFFRCLLLTPIGPTKLYGAVFSRSGRALLFGILVGLGTSGCLSPKSYIDPQFRHATLADLKIPSVPTPVVIKTSFEVNGKPKPSVDAIVRSRALKVIRATRVLAERPSDEQAPVAHLDLVVNNVGDLAAAGAKGFGTGLTFGMAGSEVVDNYVMTAVYTPIQGQAITKTYKHALHTTIGAHAAPPGMEPVPREVAFDQIMEDMVLNLISDLQKEGSL